MNLGTRCAVQWGVCPECVGEPLLSADGVSRCVRCERVWGTDDREPCPDVTAAVATDGRGGEGRLCRSHAECAKRQVPSCIVRYDDGTELRGPLPAPAPAGATQPTTVLSLGAFRAQAPVFVVPYDQRWPSRFEAERALLQPVLGSWLVADIEHIGSTAIPGLAAKPIIDIMAPVASLESSRAALSALTELHYNYFPYREDVMHWLCKPSDSYRTHHLHLVAFNSPLWNERIAFRNHLRVQSSQPNTEI
jgi:GrpB-like predicted nucleotidyltransferase (UPF0157 family)